MKMPTLLNTQFLGFSYSFKSEESCFASFFFFLNNKISEYFMCLHLLYVLCYIHATCTKKIKINDSFLLIRADCFVFFLS